MNSKVTEGTSCNEQLPTLHFQTNSKLLPAWVIPFWHSTRIIVSVSDLTESSHVELQQLLTGLVVYDLMYCSVVWPNEGFKRLCCSSIQLNFWWLSASSKLKSSQVTLQQWAKISTQHPSLQSSMLSSTFQHLSSCPFIKKLFHSPSRPLLTQRDKKRAAGHPCRYSEIQFSLLDIYTDTLVS